MGVLNVTPDSVSDGGRVATVEAAVAHGVAMAAEGAALIDVGGESTRPGHQPVTAAEEIARTEAVVARLARETDAPISIDSYKLEVAMSAVAAGASLSPIR